MTDEIVVIDSEEEENVVDNGTSYVSEETAEIAEQAAADAKRWAEESEYQAGLATNSAESAAQAKDDALSYYNLAKDWAIKTNGKVNNEDYSSKYYAQQSNAYATQAQTYAQSINPNNIVHKTGNETIGGTKTFTSDPYIYNDTPVLYHKQPNFNKGDIPQTEIYANDAFMDDSGTLGSTHQFGTYGCAISTTGETRTYLRAYRNVEGSTDGSSLEIRYPIDGNPYTYAPTPTDTTSTSSHQIATVGWANSANNNIVHKTGVETINNEKIFTANLIRAYTDITKGTNPSSPLYWGVEFTDKNGPTTANRLGLLETKLNTNGDVETYIASYLNTSGSSTQTALKIVYTKSGNKYAIAPASDVIDSIVTTTAIHKASGKGSFKLGNGMIVNYGSQQMNKDSTTVITFDTPFTGDYTYGLSTGYKSSITRADPITISDRTSTNFTARNTAREGNEVHCIWVAIGY